VLGLVDDKAVVLGGNVETVVVVGARLVLELRTGVVRDRLRHEGVEVFDQVRSRRD
jgi:hypothetical protein